MPRRGSWPPDRALAARVASGDDGAFAQLTARHRDALVSYAARRLGGSRDQAEDAVQDALVKALRALRRGKLPDNPRAWLFVIVRNCCFDLHRAVPATDELADELAADGADTADRVSHRDRLERVVTAIGDLPDSQRAMIVGRELEGLSYQELADHHRTSVGAVKSLLVRARRTLAAQPQLQAIGLPLAMVAARLRRVPALLSAPVGDPGTSLAAIATVAVTALPVAAPVSAPSPAHAHVLAAHTRQVDAGAAAPRGRPLAPSSPAAPERKDAGTATVVAACTSGQPLDGFSARSLREALDHLPDDVAQYYDCQDAIERAWLRVQAAAPRSGP
jgi:RNA polymerase sigma-70 factor (ECF subfamily)